MSAPLGDLLLLFNAWAAEGRGERMATGHWPMVRQIIPAMAIQPGMTCLDVGCGNGYAVRAMVQLVGSSGSVCGVDLSDGMLEVAEAYPDTPENVTYVVSAADNLSFDDGTFDRVLSVEVLYYVPDIQAALKEWARVLKPGGSVWVMVDYYRENPYSADWEQQVGVSIQYLSEQDYVAQFQAAGLKDVRTQRLMNPDPVDEEHFQPGWGYETPEDVRRFRTQIGSLLITGQK